MLITGVGVVAPNGIGAQMFWRNSLAGCSGIRPISLFEVGSYRCRLAGEIPEFQPKTSLGPHGLRTLDRTTCLALVAAKLALDDARLDPAQVSGRPVGVVLGSTMGSLRSISEFDLEGLREGPRYVNPALFPNAVMNSPASQVAIRFKLRGVNSTVSTGFTAALDAMGYAVDLLRLGRADTLVVGGVEELCLQTFLGFYKTGFLATQIDDAAPVFAPFHPRRCGTLLGEGAVMFVVETWDAALRRGAPVYADVLSYRTAFCPPSLRRYDPSIATAAAVLQQALDDADVAVEELDYLSAGANSTRIVDAIEGAAINRAFGSGAAHVPVSAVKSLVGETFSAAGAFQVASALGAMVHQQLPPTVRWTQDPFEGELDLVADQAREARVETAIVHATGPTGISSALVMRRIADGHPYAGASHE